MLERNVGRSGLRVSNVGLGCNNIGWLIDDDASRAVIHRALDLGITLFDTADFYGSTPGRSEEVLGRCLKGHRDEVVIATKFGVPFKGPPFDNSRRYVFKAIEGSLRRLGVDHVDIYMIHWPDPLTPMQETMRALDDLVTAGKVRYLAVSNLEAWKLVESQWIAKTECLHGFVSAQAQYSLLNREAEKDLIPALEAYGLGLSPYFPLAGGMLTGKYTSAVKATGRLADNFLGQGDQFLTAENRARALKLQNWAHERGHSLLDLAMSWLSSRPFVCGIIAGATQPEQLEQNVRAAEWRLSPEEMLEIDAL